MTQPTLFDPRPPDPKNDDAPSGNGANVKNSNTSLDPTRLPLTPPAHHHAPTGTSDRAARMIAGHAAKQRADVLAVIVSAGSTGATDAEIELATGLRAQSVSPRRGELRAMGLVIDSGTRRQTPRGRPAAVWIAATLATAALGATADAGGSEGGTR